MITYFGIHFECELSFRFAEIGDSSDKRDGGHDWQRMSQLARVCLSGCDFHGAKHKLSSAQLANIISAFKFKIEFMSVLQPQYHLQDINRHY